MIKYVKNFLSTGVVNTYNVETNAVESIGENHGFTSAEDALSKCESIVVVLWDSTFVGVGTVPTV